MSSNGDTNHDRAVIGSKDNFWLYSPRTGFDLTHPPAPDSPAISPAVEIETTKASITIDPAKSALIIIDMQNYFLSTALGRSKGAGHAAMEQLIDAAIPACRKAGIRVVWVNWGLTEEELANMPPGVKNAFGFKTAGNDGTGTDDTENMNRKRVRRGIGTPLGSVKDPQTGKDIDAGRALMRDSWNTALCPPLDGIYEEGSKLASRPDVWIHKNRMSAMWGRDTLCEQFLQQEKISTLLFAGVNTDQCVGGTLQDCFSKGYDCVLLKDGCGTTSPGFAQECIEFNAERTFGFVTRCRDVAEGVARMEGV